MRTKRTAFDLAIREPLGNSAERCSRSRGGRGQRQRAEEHWEAVNLSLEELCS